MRENHGEMMKPLPFSGPSGLFEDNRRFCYFLFTFTWKLANVTPPRTLLTRSLAQREIPLVRLPPGAACKQRQLPLVVSP